MTEKTKLRSKNHCFETPRKLFSALEASKFLKYLISTESLRSSWHFICITQGNHVLHQWWETGTTAADLVPQTKSPFHELLLRNTQFSLPATKQAWITQFQTDALISSTVQCSKTHSLKLRWRQKHLHGILLRWKDKTGLTTLQIRERNLEHSSCGFQADWSWDKNATGNQVWENN